MFTVEESTAPNTSDKPLGLWRDGRLLVLDRDAYQFPMRCIKSDRADDVCWQVVNSDPNSLLVDGFMITMGALHSGPKGMAGVSSAMKAQRDRSVLMKLPLSRSWLARWKRKSRVGWSLVGGGIALLFASTAGAVVGSAALPMEYQDLLMAVFMLAFLLAVVLAIGGAAYMVSSQRPIFTVKRVKQDYLWISGVSLTLLSELPAWDERV